MNWGAQMFGHATSVQLRPLTMGRVITSLALDAQTNMRAILILEPCTTTVPANSFHASVACQ